MRSPAFQFYAADYLADEQVQLMTIEEEGCYVRLLAYCWREESIPSDDASLARLCKGSNAFRTVIEQCFTPDQKNPSRLINKRLRIEAKKQEQHRKAKQKAGVESGKSRREKKLSAEHLLDSVQTNDEQKRTSHLLSSSSTSVLIKPLTPFREELAKAAGEIHAAHPGCRRDIGCGEIQKRLIAILKHKKLLSTGGKPLNEALPYLRQIVERHTLFCQSHDWTKDGGEYAKGLNNWLAPTIERYDQEPAQNGARASPETNRERYLRELDEVTLEEHHAHH